MHASTNRVFFFCQASRLRLPSYLLARGSHVDGLPIFPAVVELVVVDAAVGDHVVRHEGIRHEVLQAYALPPAQQKSKEPNSKHATSK